MAVLPHCFLLYNITPYVRSYLSEIGYVFCRLVAADNLAYKGIEDFYFAGVRFLIQFMDKNTVDKLMDILVGQFADLRIFTDKSDKPFYVRAALGRGLYLAG